MKRSTKIFMGTGVCMAITLSITADTHYVDVSNPVPVSPYTNWMTAANDIKTAVNKADNGDTVLVTNGTYAATSQITLQKSLWVTSVNGPEVTTVDAGNSNRVFRIKGNNGPCTLQGFTISGGISSSGGAVLAEGAGPVIIAGCVIENNNSTSTGGGLALKATSGETADTLVRDCIIRNNTALGTGSGVYSKINDESDGSITIEDCMISGNTAVKDGGGMWLDAINGTITVSRCLVYDNETAKHGGGLRCKNNIALNDSLIIDNTSLNRGGGSHGGGGENSRIVNCTISNNSAAKAAGGIHNSVLVNSIIYFNHADKEPDVSGNSTATNSCAANLDAGVDGNITNAPMFIDRLGGNYRLLMTSPCVDSGLNDLVSQPVDFDWNPRIVDGDFDGTARVDMGAYEFQLITATIDIKPGSDTNPVNLKSKGRSPVALLTTEALDAADVDSDSVRFAGAAPVHSAFEDVDADGDMDLILHFLTQELDLMKTSTKAYLIGQTYDAVLLMAVDSIRIVPSKK